MKFLRWLWRLLFGKRDDGAWVIVKIGEAEFRLYNQATIDWFFSKVAQDSHIDCLTIRRGSVGVAKENVTAIVKPWPGDGSAGVTFVEGR